MDLRRVDLMLDDDDEVELSLGDTSFSSDEDRGSATPSTVRIDTSDDHEDEDEDETQREECDENEGDDEVQDVTDEQISIPRIMMTCENTRMMIAFSHAMIVEIDNKGSVRLCQLGGGAMVATKMDYGEGQAVGIYHPAVTLIKREDGLSHCQLFSGTMIQWGPDGQRTKITGVTAWELLEDGVSWSPFCEPINCQLHNDPTVSIFLQTPESSVNGSGWNVEELAKSAIVIPNQRENSFTLILGPIKIRQNLTDGETRFGFVDDRTTGRMRYNPTKMEMAARVGGIRFFNDPTTGRLFVTSHKGSLRLEDGQLRVDQTPGAFDVYGSPIVCVNIIPPAPPQMPPSYNYPHRNPFEPYNNLQLGGSQQPFTTEGAVTFNWQYGVQHAPNHFITQQQQQPPVCPPRPLIQPRPQPLLDVNPFEPVGQSNHIHHHYPPQPQQNHSSPQHSSQHQQRHHLQSQPNRPLPPPPRRQQISPPTLPQDLLQIPDYEILNETAAPHSSLASHNNDDNSHFQFNPAGAQPPPPPPPVGHPFSAGQHQMMNNVVPFPFPPPDPAMGLLSTVQVGHPLLEFETPF